jgi:hypothetical protein
VAEEEEPTITRPAGRSGAKPVVAPLINIDPTQKPARKKREPRKPTAIKFKPPTGAIDLVRSAPNIPIATDTDIPTITEDAIPVSGVHSRRVTKSRIAMFIDIDSTNISKDNLEELFSTITARQQILFAKIYGYDETRAELNDLIEKYNIRTAGKLDSKAIYGNRVDFRVLMDAYECVIKNSRVTDTVFVWTAPCELSYLFEKIINMGVATSTIDNPNFDCENEWCSDKIKLFSYYDPIAQMYPDQQYGYDYTGQPYEQQTVYDHTAYDQTAYDQTAYDQTAYDQTAYDQTAVETPVYQQPAYETPVYEQPSPDQPVYEQPTYEQPAVEEPVYEQPVYEQPVAEEPVVEQPLYEQPATEQPIEQEIQQSEQDIISASTDAPAPQQNKEDDFEPELDEVKITMKEGFGSEADMDSKPPETEEDNRMMVMDMMKDMGFDFGTGGGDTSGEMSQMNEPNQAGNLDDI